MSEFYQIINVFKHSNPYALCSDSITKTYNIYCSLINVHEYRHDTDDGWKFKMMAEWEFDESVAWIYNCAVTHDFSILDVPLHKFRLPGVELRNKRFEDIMELIVQPHVDFKVSRTIAETIFNMLLCRLKKEAEIRQQLMLSVADSNCAPHVRYDERFLSEYNPMRTPHSRTRLLSENNSSQDTSESPAWSCHSDESEPVDEDDNIKPVKRRPGRPKGSIKKVRPLRGVSVPEFLRDLLFSEEFCPEIIKWVDPKEGKFKFVSPKKVAKLWGEMKQNNKMNFGKFSRAMRYHYQHGVLIPINQRLIYQFGPNGPDFKTNNPNLVKVSSELDSPSSIKLPNQPLK